MLGALRFAGVVEEHREVCFHAGQTVIEREAFARNPDVVRVDIPEGIEWIGEGAFRGCRNLAEVRLPSTLKGIGAGAFSCTALQSIELPAACTQLDVGALCTGPVFPGSERQTYRSSLKSIAVHLDNPVFCMRGPLLCRRVAAAAGEGACGEGSGRADIAPKAFASNAESLSAVLCPQVADAVVLSPDISHVECGAFAGTVRVGSLRLHEGLAFDPEQCLLPNEACGHVAIDLEKPVRGALSVELEVPGGQAGRAFLRAAFSGGRIDVPSALGAYDEVLLNDADELGRARRMAARLANPVHLASSMEERFRAELAPGLMGTCLQLGARNDWAALEDFASARLLTAGAVAEAVGRLSDAGYALAAGFLLDVKRRHFGKVALDYAL